MLRNSNMAFPTKFNLSLKILKEAHTSREANTNQKTRPRDSKFEEIEILPEVKT